MGKCAAEFIFSGYHETHDCKACQDNFDYGEKTKVCHICFGTGQDVMSICQKCKGTGEKQHTCEKEETNE